MSVSVGLRETDLRAVTVDGARRPDGAARVARTTAAAADFSTAIAAPQTAGRLENPLEAAVAAFLGSDRRLADTLGAPQFPLALAQAAALLEDLAAAGGAGAAADADGVAALTGQPALAPEDAALFRDAAGALAQHLEARAAFRADAARLVKT